MNSNGIVTPPPPVPPYQPPIPCPQRVAWAKLSKFEPRFTRFLDVPRQICANVPFLEALKKAPVYFKFLRELLSNKGEPEGVPVVPIEEVCSLVL